MSLLNQTWRILGALAFIAFAPLVQAQQNHLPLAEPMEFNPDWQWFAPVDVDELAENSLRKRGNYGWFVSHDRMRIWVTRPDTAATSNYAGDFAMGQRTDLGFVRENGDGWLVNFSKLTNLDFNHTTVTERINRRNTTDPAENMVGLSNSTSLILPPQDRNDRDYLYRMYPVQDSLNVGRYYNLEVNRTWRRSPYRYGGVLEPLAGIKFASFTDMSQDQQYVRPVATEELLSSRETNNLNRLLGGQVGARYFNSYHRWRLGMEFRTFLAANFQTTNEHDNTERTTYNNATLGAAVLSNTSTSVLTTTTRQRTVWGFEWRADAAYQVTKYLGLRGGLQVIDLANGIRRGGRSILGGDTSKDQNVFMAGVTFGLELNR